MFGCHNLILLIQATFSMPDTRPSVISTGHGLHGWSQADITENTSNFIDYFFEGLNYNHGSLLSWRKRMIAPPNLAMKGNYLPGLGFTRGPELGKHRVCHSAA
jgi:hypothetical protein